MGITYTGIVPTIHPPPPPPLSCTWMCLACESPICSYNTLAKKIETTARTWHRRVICRACTRLCLGGSVQKKFFVHYPLLCLTCVPVSIFLARVVLESSSPWAIYRWCPPSNNTFACSNLQNTQTLCQPEYEQVHMAYHMPATCSLVLPILSKTQDKPKRVDKKRTPCNKLNQLNEMPKKTSLSIISRAPFQKKKKTTKQNYRKQLNKSTNHLVQNVHVSGLLF